MGNQLWDGRLEVDRKSCSIVVGWTRVRRRMVDWRRETCDVSLEDFGFLRVVEHGLQAFRR